MNLWPNLNHPQNTPLNNHNFNEHRSRAIMQQLDVFTTLHFNMHFRIAVHNNKHNTLVQSLVHRNIKMEIPSKCHRSMAWTANSRNLLAGWSLWRCRHFCMFQTLVLERICNPLENGAENSLWSPDELHCESGCTIWLGNCAEDSL